MYLCTKDKHRLGLLPHSATHKWGQIIDWRCNWQRQELPRSTPAQLNTAVDITKDDQFPALVTPTRAADSDQVIDPNLLCQPPRSNEQGNERHCNDRSAPPPPAMPNLPPTHVIPCTLHVPPFQSWRIIQPTSRSRFILSRSWSRLEIVCNERRFVLMWGRKWCGSNNFLFIDRWRSSLWSFTISRRWGYSMATIPNVMCPPFDLSPISLLDKFPSLIFPLRCSIYWNSGTAHLRGSCYPICHCEDGGLGRTETAIRFAIPSDDCSIPYTAGIVAFFVVGPSSIVLSSGEICWWWENYWIICKTTNISNDRTDDFQLLPPRNCISISHTLLLQSPPTEHLCADNYLSCLCRMVERKTPSGCCILGIYNCRISMWCITIALHGGPDNAYPTSAINRPSRNYWSSYWSIQFVIDSSSWFFTLEKTHLARVWGVVVQYCW